MKRYIAFGVAAVVLLLLIAFVSTKDPAPSPLPTSTELAPSLPPTQQAIVMYEYDFYVGTINYDTSGELELHLLT